MPQRILPRAASRRGRPFPASPVFLRSPGETLEGCELLDEVPGGEGVLLWRALRTATLWASVRPRGRGRLFAPGACERWLRDAAGVPTHAALREPLRLLAPLLASPRSGAAERVARACTEIAEWAAESGAPRTALAFSQAAATAVPESAPAALATALRAEEVGQEIRAEGWLRRAIVLARGSRDPATQAEASLHLAGILARRGEEARAARMYARAQRLARKSGPRRVPARALREIGGADRSETSARAEPRSAAG